MRDTHEIIDLETLQHEQHLLQHVKVETVQLLDNTAVERRFERTKLFELGK